MTAVVEKYQGKQHSLHRKTRGADAHERHDINPVKTSELVHSRKKFELNNIVKILLLHACPT